MNAETLFAIIRRLKGSPLVQSEVDEINAAIGDEPVGEPSGQMRVGKAGLDLIHSFESCKLDAYPDPGSADGKPASIGWGSTGPDITLGLRWTQQQCDERFAKDLARFEQGVLKALGGAPVTQSQFDALTSAAYNIGLGAIEKSTLIKKHKAGDYEGAAQEFRRWVHNDGKVMKGLVRRRASEAMLYQGGPP